MIIIRKFKLTKALHRILGQNSNGLGLDNVGQTWIKQLQRSVAGQPILKLTELFRVGSSIRQRNLVSKAAISILNQTFGKY